MGCICSKGEMQDLNPNIFFVTHACRFDDWPSYFAFQVTNFDSDDNLVKRGRLEVAATDIIFHQADSSPINWPLRYLRRYGWDSELFSFESGRRAPSGTGIYAFKCPRAQEVFNLLQARFAAEESLANALQEGSNARRHTSTVDGYLEPVAPRLVPRFRTASASPNGGARVRLDSVDSCSETQSPTPSTSTPTTVIENSVVRSESGLSSGLATGLKQLWDPSEPRPDERNNNGHEYSNGVITSSGLRLVDSFPAPLPLDANRLVETDNNHVYMNVSPGTDVNFLILNQAVPAQCFKPSLSNLVIREESAESQPCYANLEIPEIPEEEVMLHNGGCGSGVNYAVLDLEAGNAVTSPSSLTPTPTGAAPAAAAAAAAVLSAPISAPPDSPNGQAPAPTGYVTIDFKKTKALSNSVKAQNTDTEATRKTRHNSTLPPD